MENEDTESQLVLLDDQNNNLNDVIEKYKTEVKSYMNAPSSFFLKVAKLRKKIEFMEEDNKGLGEL